MNGWRQRVGVGILTAVFGLTVMAAVVVDGPCYEDVRVRGGHDKVNGRYRFVEMVDDGPWWECPSCPDSDETALWYRSAKKDWLLISFISSGPDWFYVVYLNDAPPGTPPSSGWRVSACDNVDPPCSLPRVSGGDPCEGTGEPEILITLTNALELPEGEDPPMIGSLPLAAEFCLGEEIGVDLAVVDTEGEPILNTQVSAVLCTVEITEDAETREALLKAAEIPDRRSGDCHIGFSFEDLMPGIYDLQLRVSPNVMDRAYFRVRLTTCEDGVEVATDCYTDVVVTGAGEEEANETYGFRGLNAETGWPAWSHYSAVGEGINRVTANQQLGFDVQMQAWEITVTVRYTGAGRTFHGYVNYSTARTPPSTGWEPHPDPMYSSALPAPTLYGGAPCPDIED